MLLAVMWRGQRSIIKVQRAVALKWPLPLRLYADSVLGGLTKEVNRPDRRPNDERRREIRALRCGSGQCRLGQG